MLLPFIDQFWYGLSYLAFMVEVLFRCLGGTLNKTHTTKRINPKKKDQLINDVREHLKTFQYYRASTSSSPKQFISFMFPLKNSLWCSCISLMCATHITLLIILDFVTLIIGNRIDHEKDHQVICSFPHCPIDIEILHLNFSHIHPTSLWHITQGAICNKEKKRWLIPSGRNWDNFLFLLPNLG